MGFWLQVDTGAGTIFANLQTADASSLPTEPGGTWVEVQESEYALAVDGERTSWNNVAAVGARVEENPYPRLRFTGGNVTGKPYEFAVEVGEVSPPQVTMTAVDRDGNALTLSVSRTIVIEGSSRKHKKISMVNGVATFDIPVTEPRIIEIGDQEKILNNANTEVDGFLVEAPLLVVIAEAVANTVL